jgi:hypothetical protein
MKAAYSRFAPDDTGLYTDSVSYTHLIPECTNISVGYEGAHSSNERFDLEFLMLMLLPSLMKVDYSALPAVRDPSVKENYGAYASRYRRHGNGGYDVHNYNFVEGAENDVGYEGAKDANLAPWPKEGDSLPLGWAEGGGNTGAKGKKTTKQIDKLAEEMFRARVKPPTPESKLAIMRQMSVGNPVSSMPYDLSMGIVPELSAMQMRVVLIKFMQSKGNVAMALALYTLLTVMDGKESKLAFLKDRVRIQDKMIDNQKATITEYQGTLKALMDLYNSAKSRKTEMEKDLAECEVVCRSQKVGLIAKHHEIKLLQQQVADLQIKLAAAAPTTKKN